MKKILRVFVLLICVPLFCLSSYKVGSQLIVDYRQDQAFNALAAQVNRARSSASLQNGAQTAQPVTADSVLAGSASALKDDGLSQVPSSAEANAPASGDSISALDASASAPQVNASTSQVGASTSQAGGANTPAPSATPEPTVMPDYAPLYAQNTDLFGWIEIEDTVVNYPVMHTPADPEFYLHRAFDGSEAYSGVPFLDAQCFIDCGNYIIYGHHMKNKTIFQPITNYSEESFWEEHPLIRFDTLYETGVYAVMAAFYSKVYLESQTDVFAYYHYNDLTDPWLYEEYVTQAKAAALYDTGIDAEYGDQLITLSTCEYHTHDGRFVVVARRLRPDEVLQ